MKGRVTGRARVPQAALETALRPVAAAHRLILGVDPSLRGTGYGVVQWARTEPRGVAHGTLRCPTGWERSRCLAHIAVQLREVIRAHRPTVGVVEGLFYAQNLRTAIILGEARGAALAVMAEAGLEVYELAPRKVKQAIVGYGGAQKLAVSRMVQRFLKLAEAPAPDAADALALALAFGQEIGRYALAAPKRV